MNKQLIKLARQSEVSEKAIEQYLVKQVRKAGGICLKYFNPGETGYPDRICLLPAGKIIFVELKSKGEKPRKNQLVRMNELKSIGFEVHICDSREFVDTIIEEATR